MPWQIGIDEAGYGPNLGPFVMTLVACRVPQELHEASLWDVLKSTVRRAEEPDDGRLVVADSKQVYSPASGLHALEKSVLSSHRRVGGIPDTLATLLHTLAAEEVPGLRKEAWYAGDTVLPVEADAAELQKSCSDWHNASESAGVTWSHCRCAVVPTPRFNDLIDKWDSKGAVLGLSMAQLLQQCLAETDAEATRIVVDKHGGRNTYAALLQHAYPDGFVLAEEEGRSRSTYRVEGLDRSVRVTFVPKADVEHFTVALASMYSKYVRELLMREFNRFWQEQVPGLEPTAGYPLDAARYFAAIRPVLAKLALEDRAVWRCR